MKRYSEDHQWVEVNGELATIGITAYAAEELGEITFVELPDLGSVLSPGDTLCVVESAKAASDVFVPIGGTVREVNMALESEPSLINASAERDGWICTLEDVDLGELDSLMDEDDYEAFVERGGAEE
jgi:glycine cleavage system H protein